MKYLLIKHKKALYSTLTNMLDVGVYPILLILSTPFFIEKLGDYEFGIWILINSIIASLGVLNIGLGDAIIKYVSKYLALKNIEKVNQIIKTTFSVYLILVGSIVFVGLIFLNLNDYYLWIKIENSSGSSVSQILKIAIIIFGLKLIEQIFLSVFKGFERFDIASILSLFIKILGLGLSVILASLSYQLYDIFLMNLVVTSIGLIIEAIILKKFHPTIDFRPGIDKHAFLEVVNFGIWSWGQSILGIIAGQIDKFIVVYFAGVKVLAYYSLGLNVANQIHVVFAAGIGWIFPKISKMVEMGGDIENLYDKLQRAILIVGIGVVAFILIFEDFIFRIWLGEIIYQKSSEIIKEFLLYESLLLVTIVPYYFLNATGHIKLNTFFMTLTLIFKCILISIFFYFIKIEGLVLGQIVSLILCVPLQIYFKHKILNGRKSLYSEMMVIFPSFLLILGTFIYKFSFSFSIAIYISLTIYMLLQVIELFKSIKNVALVSSNHKE